MDTQQFWQLIEDARAEAGGGAGGEEIAERASALLAGRTVPEILGAQQVLWDLLAVSYTHPLWAAAHLVNGGCSDDGFDYFRGWLITQGREVFERAVADPDSLAGLAGVVESLAGGGELECEDTLGIAWAAYRSATGQQIPDGAFGISYPALDPDWGFDFDDEREMARRLPRLAALAHG
ncbi:DUF4240 domain-containing protein [Streptomyces sp. NPDC090022]|uniref:DUF4240 domain-containing protein n=1 Tax=Streptomyces sp. NPDC090022 TaxID=3365920 RepID=UPI00381F4A1D